MVEINNQRVWEGNSMRLGLGEGSLTASLVYHVSTSLFERDPLILGGRYTLNVFEQIRL